MRMLNLGKCKQLLRIFAIMTLIMTVLAFTSCDVIQPILDKVGIDINIGGNDDPSDDNPPDDDVPGDDVPGDVVPDDNVPDDNTPTECEHEWSSPEVIAVPTCGTDEKGIERSTCTKCSETLDTETEARDSHEIERSVVTEVQCGVDGLEKEECKHCDYFEEFVIDAPEHSLSFMPVPDEDGKYGNVCVNCGYVESYAEIVTYEQFGAVGDGVTDDSEAIRAAHDYANKNGLPVYGNADSTYYIGVLEETITVKTDTNWNGATFIFDDSNIHWDDAEHRQVNVFTIAPETYRYSVSVPVGMTLSKGQTNIGMTFDKPCMIRVENSEEKIYIRFGENKNSGSNKKEMLLVDENGNVDPSTPIQYDYSGITKIYVYSIDDEPISFGNGKIITRVPNPRAQDPDYENNYCFFYRGVSIQRSNVTLYGIEHRIYGEDMTIETDRNGDGTIDKWGADKSYGVPYTGFYTFEGCYNVTFKDSFVQGHQAYSFYQLNEDTGGISRNEMGSYDIYANHCVDLSFINIVQYENEATGEVITNRFMYHGIMGTNFCRNLVMDDCYVDRFDAHQAMYNATLTDSTFGFGILVIGDGTLYIENVYRISQGPFISLRNDYNSIFLGDIIIKDSRMGIEITSIVGGGWRSFYNGIPNWVCSSITIDGLVTEKNTLEIFNITSAGYPATVDEVNPLYLPKYIMVSNVKTSDGGDVTVKASAFADALSTVMMNPDQYQLWLDEHTFGEGVVVVEPSTTDCTPGLIRFTCTDCGIVAERVIASAIPHASLEHTSFDGVITYNCTVCNHAFTPEMGYFMDGTDHNGIIGVGNSAHFNTAEGSQNPLINDNGEYELLKKNARQAAKIELWIPNTLSDIDKLSAENDATGYLSFKINAYTDNYLNMQFVDTESNKSSDRWTANGCLVDYFFSVSAPVDGVVSVTGWDEIVLKSVTVGDDNFTGWFDVKIIIELDAEDDTVTLHYYIDGEYVDSASKELTTLTDSINSVYIIGNTKAKGSGIMLDDIAFGCRYKKYTPVEE